MLTALARRAAILKDTDALFDIVQGTNANAVETRCALLRRLIVDALETDAFCAARRQSSTCSTFSGVAQAT